jgi:hypothetical protein
VTCPEAGDNGSKGPLIPKRIASRIAIRVTAFREGPAAHQLVGRVMAYQGDDG